jgi:hypothetical protein
VNSGSIPSRLGSTSFVRLFRNPFAKFKVQPQILHTSFVIRTNSIKAGSQNQFYCDLKYLGLACEAFINFRRTRSPCWSKPEASITRLFFCDYMFAFGKVLEQIFSKLFLNQKSNIRSDLDTRIHFFRSKTLSHKHLLYLFVGQPPNCVWLCNDQNQLKIAEGRFVMWITSAVEKEAWAFPKRIGSMGS